MSLSEGTSVRFPVIDLIIFGGSMGVSFRDLEDIRKSITCKKGGWNPL